MPTNCLGGLIKTTSLCTNDITRRQQSTPTDSLESARNETTKLQNHNPSFRAILHRPILTFTPPTLTSPVHVPCRRSATATAKRRTPSSPKQSFVVTCRHFLRSAARHRFVYLIRFKRIISPSAIHTTHHACTAVNVKTCAFCHAQRTSVFVTAAFSSR